MKSHQTQIQLQAMLIYLCYERYYLHKSETGEWPKRASNVGKQEQIEDQTMLRLTENQNEKENYIE